MVHGDLIHEFIECTSLAEFNNFCAAIVAQCGCTCEGDIYQNVIKHKTEDKWLLIIKFNMRE